MATPLTTADLTFTRDGATLRAGACAAWTGLAAAAIGPDGAAPAAAGVRSAAAAATPVRPTERRVGSVLRRMGNSLTFGICGIGLIVTLGAG